MLWKTSRSSHRSTMNGREHICRHRKLHKAWGDAKIFHGGTGNKILTAKLRHESSCKLRCVSIRRSCTFLETRNESVWVLCSMMFIDVQCSTRSHMSHHSNASFAEMLSRLSYDYTSNHQASWICFTYIWYDSLLWNIAWSQYNELSDVIWTAGLHSGLCSRKRRPFPLWTFALSFSWRPDGWRLLDMTTSQFSALPFCVQPFHPK